MEGVVAPWLAEVILISVRRWKASGTPPYPSELAATFVIFGAISFLPNKRLTAALGWGFVVASALNLLPQSIQPKATQAQKPTDVLIPGSGANVAANRAIAVGGYVGAVPPTQIPPSQ